MPSGLIAQITLHLPKIGEIVMPEPWTRDDDALGTNVNVLIQGTHLTTDIFAALPVGNDAANDPAFWIFKNLETDQVNKIVEVTWETTPASGAAGNLLIPAGGFSFVSINNSFAPSVKSLFAGKHSRLMFWGIGTT